MGRVTVWLGGILVLCAALFGATFLAAAESPQSKGSLGKGAPNANPTEAVEVVVNNRKIFEMRGNLLGYPRSSRARCVEARIGEVTRVETGLGEIMSPQGVPKAKWYAAPAGQPLGDGVPTASGANRKGGRP